MYLVKISQKKLAKLQILPFNPVCLYYVVCFERENIVFSRRRNLIGYKNFSEGALPLVSCLFTISAVCLQLLPLLLLLAGKFKLLVVAS